MSSAILIRLGQSLPFQLVLWGGVRLYSPNSKMVLESIINLLLGHSICLCSRCLVFRCEDVS